jgi:hypothetical protein
MLTPRRLLVLATLVAVAVAVAAAVPAGAGATAPAPRAPIKDCGDISTLDRDSSFALGAVTAQNTTCKNARAIAREVAKSAGCKRQGSCRRLNYTCLLAKAGKELTLVRCEGKSQTAFVRFEFGS